MPDKISAIVPCLWANEELFEMTIKCLRGIKEVDELIVINRDRSYAGNVNAGLKIAEGEFIIICNNDIEFVQHDWLHHLTWPLEEYDICSIRTSDSDGWETKDEFEEGAKFGSIWAMKRKVYETIGGLDESFGNYAEDLDYRRRVLNAGFKIVKNHNGLVHHIGKVTAKTIDPDDNQYRAALEKYKEKWGFIE